MERMEVNLKLIMILKLESHLWVIVEIYYLSVIRSAQDVGQRERIVK
jgi:hypothetical protein